VIRIAPAGAVNGLAQTMLKMTTPGVPDFYQGTEFWDFSLVDPDNRRPVDFTARSQALDRSTSADALIGSWRDGRIKQRVVARTLSLRRQLPALFADGDYAPAAVTGARDRHLLAFTRSHGDQHCLVVVPRLPFGLLHNADSIMLGDADWQDTAIELPPVLRGKSLRDEITGTTLPPQPTLLPVALAFQHAPVALLRPAA
jgi:(1->4)-alpha-D-glucan 1-alpha-D-glucosylmutase